MTDVPIDDEAAQGDAPEEDDLDEEQDEATENVDESA